MRKFLVFVGFGIALATAVPASAEEMVPFTISQGTLPHMENPAWIESSYRIDPPAPAPVAVTDEPVPSDPQAVPDESHGQVDDGTSTEEEPQVLSADAPAPAPAPRITWKKDIEPWVITHVALSAMDTAETAYCRSKNTCRELNPILGKYPSPGKVVGVKIGMEVGWYLLIRHLYHIDPKAAKVFGIASVVVQGGIVAANARFVF